MRSLFLLAGSILSLARYTTAQTVKVSNGTIQGGKCATTDVNYFFSIPFAEPPVGDLRFAKPQPYARSFNGTLNGTRPTSSCIQFSATTFAETNEQSEDCLLLNVWAPATATSSSALPVKVWIYGGTNEAGGISDPTYNGCYSATDSIVVSVNYRLGPLGFLALTSLGANGNFGLLDQLQALQWVKENIAAFGGDPTKVLLFGQSAGANDAFVLATLPQASKYFSSVALQSGAGRDYPTIKRVAAWHSVWLSKLNCTDRACALAATPAQLQAAHFALPAEPALGAGSPLENGGAGKTWGPVVDGTFIAANPATVGVQVPAILGSNTVDASLFVAALYVANATALSAAGYDEFLTYNFGSVAAAVNSTYSTASFTRTAPRAPIYAAMIAVFTAYTFTCPTYRALAQGARNGVPVWAYSFGHTPSCGWYKSITAAQAAVLGATHTAEIPFVFNTTTDLPLGSGNCSFNPSEVALAASMSGAWTSMAANGQPGTAEFWPPFTVNDTLGVNIGDAITAGVVDYSLCVNFWDAVSAKVVALASNGTAGNTTNSTATTSAGLSGTPTATSSSSSAAATKNAVMLGQVSNAMVYGTLVLVVAAQAL